MSALENLSERDRAVLRSIFDPTATVGDVVDDADDYCEEEEDITDADKGSIALCEEGVRLAEAGNLEEALKKMDAGVAAAPARAAAYNDRAQQLRLMKRDDDAMKDLNRALELTMGEAGAAGARRVRALALCQRGVLLRQRGADADARAVFTEAAQLGSGFAKKQVVELNPYAALCNQMLSQVLRGDKDITI